MNLDPVAFGLTSVLLSAISGGLLIFAFLQNRSLTALKWWGCSFWLAAGGIALLALCGSLIPVANVAVGNGLLALAFGLQYVGSRVFNERPPSAALAFWGAGIWLGLWPLIHISVEVRVVVMAAIASIYCYLTLWELWRNAPRRLPSQSAVIVVVSCSALYFTLRVLFGLMPDVPFWTDVFASRWSAGMGLFLLLYTPTLAFLMLSMAKEREEFEYRQAALLDPLTRISNRRAVFADAERLIAERKGRPISCLVFDLDDFKIVNDTYGHQAGDMVLRTFAQTLNAHLPACAFGRLGGDEFCAFLDLDGSQAGSIARTIRSEFLKALARATGGQLRTTVSIGCATASGLMPQELLTHADAALYQAKSDGRDAISAAANDIVAPAGSLPAHRDRRDRA